MKYQIVYADPPWRQTKGGLRSVRPYQERQLDYPVMSMEDIRTLYVKLSSHFSYNHTLFLWAIDKYLHESEKLFTDLGYRLHARIIWDKGNGVAPAFTVRYSHEYLLWLYKPTLMPVAQGMRGKYTTVIREPSTTHSRKPDAAYRMIEGLYPEHTKIELFARHTRLGWDCWGNEVVGSVEI